MKESKEKELEDRKKTAAIITSIPLIISIALFMGLLAVLFALRACGAD